MRKTGEFLKTTLLGGVIAIVPLGAVAFVLWSILGVLIEVVDAMEGVLPFSPAVNTLIVFLASLVALVLLCFLAGLALRTRFGSTMKQRVDGILERFVPLYGAARTLTKRVSGGGGAEFSPALIDVHGTEARVLGWVVEQLSDERSAVYVPLTPIASFGQVYIVPDSQIEVLEVPIVEMIGPVTEWGAGTRRLFEMMDRGADETEPQAEPQSQSQPQSER